MLELDGSMVVADALNCQKETASSIRQAGGDYLLSVKDNQPTLKEEIESYAQTSELQKGMGTFTTVEKKQGPDRGENRLHHRQGQLVGHAGGVGGACHRRSHT